MININYKGLKNTKKEKNHSKNQNAGKIEELQQKEWEKIHFWQFIVLIYYI